MSTPVAVALVHYPIVDRRGDTVSTAVTNLDLHDIARTARTYGVDRFYVITPVVEQQTLVRRILAHWHEGHGAAYNPHRGEALSLIRVVASLDEALADWRSFAGPTAEPVLTGASRTDGIGVDACRALLDKIPLMLVFGTGWGLAPELFECGWKVLEPIRGRGVYNHLPVRAAAAIILDRLLGTSA
ncbi:protein of unknown function DUF2168 [Syntrophotalea carbinolica DSM 2380]|uniref:tRNA (guanine-N(1)-)-methyltransferase C-terminal domain-containing protein n=1 Tax=Syntrophotalea carbinolica (strain DSM 2380 / NBRC 103641 / GraBd1) TaxID=338963 RepID=Q3A2E8_SYNC1|nr:RNA methyltransferase [Syntrophotalea carbinolica]ABA89459.1 protein of unknown function DUF2168 [Syntrophotalea carbinolica DSM 2380]